MTGTRPQLYNGIILLFTFFSCRLVYGTYQSIRVYQDIWAALGAHPMLSSDQLLKGTLRYATATSTVPLWLALSLFVSNVTLNSLNFYWFVLMIKAVSKRFQPAKRQEDEPIPADEAVQSGAKPQSSQITRRKA